MKNEHKLRYTKLLIVILIFITLFSCESEKTKEGLGVFNVTEIKESLVEEHHDSEGILLSLDNGVILNFFRRSEGTEGNHADNKGGVYKRTSYDKGVSWSRPVVVYNDSLDDRNLRGGITDNGEIILFFRRYDAENKKSVDLNYIISKDGGNSWSQRKKIIFNLEVGEEVWIDNFIKVNTNRYLLPIHGVSYCELRYLSYENGNISISDKIWDWDYTSNNKYMIDEPSFSYLGNGKLIGIFRDESKLKGSNYFQVSSLDYGKTWTKPERTNICEPFFAPAPLIFYDTMLKRIVVIGTDRRRPANGGYSPEDSELWIYTNEIEEVFNNPSGYNLIKKMSRPEPSSFRFYGYPTFTRINSKSLLVVFTDSSYNGVTEDGNLYQFKIEY